MWRAAMAPKSLVLVVTLALSTFVLVGLPTTAGAEVDEECGEACVENCEAGVGTRVSATCEIAHQPYTVDTCPAIHGCGETYVECTAFDGEMPNCGHAPGPHCSHGYQGICWDFTDDYCWVWYQTYIWACLVERPPISSL